MCLSQGQNAVLPVRLKPATPQSSVKHSTTEPLCSQSELRCFTIYVLSPLYKKKISLILIFNLTCVLKNKIERIQTAEQVSCHISDFLQ